MTPAEFIKKWKPVSLTERAAAHTHFNDLCKLFEHDDPVQADPTGEWFTFEKGATKTGGGEGFADVWKKNYFAWEYKKKKRDLNAAMEQLVRYAAALENPPLQVVCDTDRFIIRTAWTNTVPKQYEIELDDLADPGKRNILRAVFHDPESLRPKETRAGITREAADKFSTIALRLQGRGTPEQVAHFVNQLVFCFFANSVKLLPDGFFPKLLKRAGQRPDKTQDYFRQLFAAMEHGGEFDMTDIAHFNGGLFDGRPPLPLDSGDVGLLIAAASLDWALIDPTIFGTLFERFLDPDKRAQIGAHYTDPDKIMMIVEPVILRPLRAEWDAARAEIEGYLNGTLKPPEIELGFGNFQFGMRLGQKRKLKPREAAEATLSRFIERLRHVSILDPACGSGNFLYLALQGVKDIELKANQECEALGLPARLQEVGPEILHGIEINPLAAELARTTIWIGDIQWRIRNGIYASPKPILRKLDAIECRDALITRVPSPPGSEGGTDRQVVDGQVKPGHDAPDYVEAEWPPAEFIVGNPPFLGDKYMRNGLGAQYTESLRTIYAGRVPGGADLVCYWFEKGRDLISKGVTQRVGFVATNSVRGGANRVVLDRILKSAFIFDAWGDEAWTVDGANVRVSLICFCSKATFNGARLDGQIAAKIFADLTAGSIDLTRAGLQAQNRGVSFLGSMKKAPFDITGELARSWMQEPQNPNGRRNSDVLLPWMNGDDVTSRSRGRWIVDFKNLGEQDATYYASPYAYVRSVVLPRRLKSGSPSERRRWWLLARRASEMVDAIARLPRFLATPRVAKHRLFVWLRWPVLPDGQLVVIARDDDTAFGILHSRFHEAWALRLGTSLEDRPRYTPTTTFETFPFPEGLTPNIPAADYASDPRAIAIAAAAKRLDELRNAWLNPPDLVVIEPEVVPGYPDRILPKDAQAAVTLKTRTLTNLYNQRPQWLADAHRDLDAAVAAAYGWPADISEEDALAKLLALNLARAGAGAVAAAEMADDAE